MGEIRTHDLSLHNKILEMQRSRLLTLTMRIKFKNSLKLTVVFMKLRENKVLKNFDSIEIDDF